jgi:hypothetical protein
MDGASSPLAMQQQMREFDVDGVAAHVDAPLLRQ